MHVKHGQNSTSCKPKHSKAEEALNTFKSGGYPPDVNDGIRGCLVPL